MSKRLLSSKFTFFYKFIFPSLWICGFGAGTIALWAGAFHDKSGSPPPSSDLYLFTLILVCGSAFLLWFSSRLTRVCLDGENLIISNYRKSATVPCKKIENISQSRLQSPIQITLELAAPTPLGDRITFIPPLSLLDLPFVEHPLVAELRSLAGLDRK